MFRDRKRVDPMGAASGICVATLGGEGCDPARSAASDAGEVRPRLRVGRTVDVLAVGGLDRLDRVGPHQHDRQLRLAGIGTLEFGVAPNGLRGVGEAR